MFNDDEEVAFSKMYGFTTVDGFVEITEDLGEMIKYLANEPSVGLFYVQQHTQNAVPNLVNLRNNIVGKSREMTLHTEDSEDSITSLRSMKECGFPIVDEMIKDITKSLAIMSTRQPKKGLIRRHSTAFQPGSSGSWGPSTWRREDVESSSGYFSTVLRSAKQKASNFKWPQLDAKELIQPMGEKFPFYLNPAQEPSVNISSATTAEGEGNELPVSSQTDDGIERLEGDESLPRPELLDLSENFDEFKAVKEAKLEEWLGGSNTENGC